MLSEKAFIWVRNLLSEINRSVVSIDNEWLSARVVLMYRNIFPFMKDYCTNANSFTILYTLYSCAIQLGVRNLGDEVESFSEFQDFVDTDDWSLVTREDITRFDIRTAQILVAGYAGAEHNEISGGGLYSLETIDFIRH
jgi:hypothetical protein